MNETETAVPPVRRLDEPQGNGRAEALKDRVRSLRLGASSTSTGKGPGGGLLPWGLAGIFFLAATAFGFLAYTRSPTGESDSTAAGTNPGDARPATSSSAPGSASSGKVLLESKGYVIASHQIQISPQVGGEIIKLDGRFKEGALFTKGDILAEVDPVIYDAQLKSAKASLAIAEVNLKQVESGSTTKDVKMARAQLKNLYARMELARLDERNKRQAGLGTSRDEVDKAIIQIDVDSAAHDAQKETLDKFELLLEEQRKLNKAQVDSAKAAVQQAQKNLDNCIIKAPVTGCVLSKKAELGGYVNPLAFGAAGYLCEMADLKQLEVELDIQERDISHIVVGNKCIVIPEAYSQNEQFKQKHPNGGYEGTYERRIPIANRSQGAIKVRVKIEIPKDEKGGTYLLPDMGVIVKFMESSSTPS